MLVDSHTHVFLDDFNADRDEVFERAREAGVERFVNVGINTSTSRQAIELSRARKDCVATVGFHPHYANSFTHEDLRELETLAREPRVVAVGEIGLDFFKNYSSHESQMRTLKVLLALVKETGLPAIFHCRDAHQELLTVLGGREWKGIRGVIHCFTGTAQEAERYIEIGLYISFAGQITFRNAKDLARTAAGVPMERTLLETDAPYLSPEPFRGRRNEPSRVRLIASEQARLHGLSEDEVARITTQNAVDLFGHSLSPDGGASA